MTIISVLRANGNLLLVALLLQPLLWKEMQIEHMEISARKFLVRGRVSIYTYYIFLCFEIFVFGLWWSAVQCSAVCPTRGIVADRRNLLFTLWQTAAAALNPFIRRPKNMQFPIELENKRIKRGQTHITLVNS